MNLNKEISSNEITQAIKAFIFSLNLYKEKINNLNVFPVPDGDTGTNMLLTIKNIDTDLDSLVDIKSLLSHLRQSSLMEARGNSGVILAQFFQGLSDGAAGVEKMTPESFAKAIKFGADADLEIYCDGTDSIISHQGGSGGDLIIQTTASDDDVFIKCNDDFIVNVQGGSENAIIARNS